MERDLFERLLTEGESVSLDFKAEQYRFVKASDEDRAELLKDIIGFANAQPRCDAYILIGVKESRGGRAEVVGIPEEDHLSDSSLQQFVHNLTNAPIRFHYEAFQCDGKQVGVVCIDKSQARPVYLKSGYGRKENGEYKLRRGDVYVRRGSSTDPTKPASPDEIARMGRDSWGSRAELCVEFADLKRDVSLGEAVELNAKYCEMPKPSSIPDLSKQSRPSPLGIDLTLGNFGVGERLNPGYYRELADYIHHKMSYSNVRLVVRNIGTVAAGNVRVELAVPARGGVSVKVPSGLPVQPNRLQDHFGPVITQMSMSALSRRHSGSVVIESDTEGSRVVVECGDLQPGRRVLSDELCVAVASSGEVLLVGRVLSSNLPTPQSISLKIRASVEQTSLSVDSLLAFADQLNNKK